MNKLYIGENEIFNGSNDSSFVDVSTFDEHEKVIASAITYIDASLKSFDASIKQIAASGGSGSGGSGSSFDPTEINSSISDISTRVHNIEADYVVADDLSTFLTEDDISTFITQATLDASYGVIDSSLKSFDASIKELATSGGGGGGSTPDLTNYATKSDISTFKPIVYTTKDDYDEDVSDGSIDETAMYVITDLADSDELSTLVTIDDLNAEKARINASLNETADAIISAANTSCGYWKDQNVSQCQSKCNSAKNTAVSAVQSQQTTSVNAVNTAKTTATSEISTYVDERVAEMKNFVVISNASYDELPTIDPNTIYFITY